MEEIWARSEGEGDIWAKLNSKLSQCRHGLVRWQRSQGEPIRRSVEKLEKRLATLQNNEASRCGDELLIVRRELQKLHDQEDLQWRQLAKSDWL